MINIKNFISTCDIIELKLNVPQVGSSIIEYDNLSDIQENIIYDFIINLDGELLIGTGHYKLNKKKKVLYFAGRLKIVDGLISYIDNDSGHFIPTYKQTNKIYNVLKKCELLTKNIELKIL